MDAFFAEFLFLALPGGASGVLRARNRSGHNIDPRHRVRRRHVGRRFGAAGIPAAFSGRRRSRARSRGPVVEHGCDVPRGDAQGGRHGKRHRRHRHHQSARNHARLGPRHGPATASRHRVARPAHRGCLHEAARTRPRTGLRGQDRTFARSLFLRHQACVAARSCAGRTGAGRARRPRLRHGRLVPVMATHRRQGARNRCHQRVAHVAVRHSSRPLGRRTLGAARRAEKCPAGRARFVRRFRRDGSGAVRRTNSDLRHRRRSAGGADRPGLFHARHGQIDLRHRMLRRAQYRHARRSYPTTNC